MVSPTISAWKKHHLHLSLAKTELLVIPRQTQITVQIGSTTLFHISTMAWSCRFVLYNTRNIKPFLSECAAQLQTFLIPRLDYCISLLVDLPATMTKPLQMIQNVWSSISQREQTSHTPPDLTPLALSCGQNEISGLDTGL